ncbi:MAG: L-fucose mutarotase [Pseudomonadota bacterium]
MLKGIDPLLTPELLMHLCAMGHGEWVAVVDANFTADYLSQGRIPVVRLPGHSLERVSQAVLSVMPLAQDVAHPAAFMKVCHSAEGHRTPAQQAVVDLVVAQGVSADKVEAVERYAFYEKIKGASLIVQSGEVTAYGNAMYCKAVILP